MTNPKENRKYMRSSLWLDMYGVPTDQQQKVPHPPLEQPYPEDAPLIPLVAPADFTVGQTSVLDAIRARRSHRRFTKDALSLEEFSFLCWATQGVHQIWRNGIAVRRTVPSAGARHPFETYLLVNNVRDIEPGLYRYLSLEHQLCWLRAEDDLSMQLAQACHGQTFVGQSAVTFIWTAIPYRTEWRYSLMSPKLVNLDAGHMCQNLYLACEAIGAGTCAIGAYNQKDLDVLLGVDGEDEFAIYVAPVGKV